MTTTPERGHKLDPTEGELPGAADVHGMHGGSAFSAKPGQLRCGDDRRAVPPGDRDRVSQVVSVTVRQQHRVDLREPRERDVGRGIAREKRVDDHSATVGLDREAGVAVERECEHA